MKYEKGISFLHFCYIYNHIKFFCCICSSCWNVGYDNSIAGDESLGCRAYVNWHISSPKILYRVQIESSQIENFNDDAIFRGDISTLETYAEYGANAW